MMNLDDVRAHDSLRKYREPEYEEYDENEPEGWTTRKGEKWKFYKDTPYEVSSHGRVRRDNKILKPRSNPKGYLYANLSYNNKSEQPGYHQMVMEVFGKKPPKNMKNPVIKHKDGNKSNNKFSNLEWGSLRNNTQEAYDQGHYKDKGNTNKAKFEKLQEQNTPDYAKK